MSYAMYCPKIKKRSLYLSRPSAASLAVSFPPARPAAAPTWPGVFQACGESRRTLPPGVAANPGRGGTLREGGPSACPRSGTRTRPPPRLAGGARRRWRLRDRVRMSVIKTASDLYVSVLTGDDVVQPLCLSHDLLEVLLAAAGDGRHRVLVLLASVLSHPQRPLQHLLLRLHCVVRRQQRHDDG